MDTSRNAYIDKGRQVSEWVWYGGTGALAEGAAVCYNYDYGTSTTREPSRFNRVANPSTTNAQYFAGVAGRAYTAVSTGQLIEIYRPGSVCNILVAVSTVIGTGLLTFDVTTAAVGQFRYAGLPGAGSAIPLQTTTYVATAQLCLALLQEGPPSGGVEVVALVDNDAIGTLMIGGTTLITGSTIGTGNCTYTLANGTQQGLRKKFGVITADITTSDFVITVTAGRTPALADSALATITFTNAASINTQCTLEWTGAWFLQGCTITQPVLA